MISGAHIILYSKKPELDRAFFKDHLKLSNVDVGDGWLIFGLPPSEIAVHPSGANDVHEFYFLTEDIEKFREEILALKMKCTAISDHGWGLLVHLTLPGGGKLGVYQARHARPKEMRGE